METRESKYSAEDSTMMSRTKRNQSLYEEISNTEITTFDVDSNSTVLGSNSNTIDIDKLRDMLDKKYREEPKPKLMQDYTKDIQEDISLNETREYDINSFLEQSKVTKESDYEKDRLQKLRNTQFDILNSLSINKENEEEEEETSKAVSKREGEKLQSLIDTINLTEATNAIKDMDPLDMFEDLKGDDEATKVFGADSLEKIEEKEDKNSDTKEVESDFETTSTVFTENDFDDFSDLKDDVSSTKIIVKVLIAIVIIAFIFGIVFLLNRVLGWGLF